jgi:hypothetical protein
MTIKDISRGGVGLVCDWPVLPGTEVQIVLPGASNALAARIARAERGLLVATFRQDEASFELLDQALAAIARRSLPKAA